MRLREAKREDVPRLMELWERFIAHEAQFDPEEFQVGQTERRRYERLFHDKMRNPNGTVLVAEEEQIVGYAMGWVRERFLAKNLCGHINDLYVLDEWRNRGIGTALLRRLLEWFTSKGVGRAELYVYTENKRALALYSKLGFEVKAQRMSKMLEE